MSPKVALFSVPCLFGASLSTVFRESLSCSYFSYNPLDHPQYGLSQGAEETFCNMIVFHSCNGSISLICGFPHVSSFFSHQMRKGVKRALNWRKCPSPRWDKIWVSVFPGDQDFVIYFSTISLPSFYQNHLEIFLRSLLRVPREKACKICPSHRSAAVPTNLLFSNQSTFSLQQSLNITISVFLRVYGSSRLSW